MIDVKEVIQVIYLKQWLSNQTRTASLILADSATHVL